MTLRRRLRLLTHPWRLSVLRLSRDTAIPAPPPGTGLFAVIRSAESLTVVRELAGRESGVVWRALEIAGPFAFTETGVLAAIAEPLAEANISIFAVNSYETEFVLVQEPDLDRARAALAKVGHVLA